MNLIEQAVEQFDLLDWVIERGAQELKPGEWEMLCPLCFKPKLIVNVDRKAWHCWVCQKYATVYVRGEPRRRAVQGAGGLLSLLQLVTGVTWGQARADVLAAGRTRMSELSRLPDKRLRRRVGLRHKKARPIDPPPYWHRVTTELPYMKARGISLEDATDFGLLWCSEGKYANRLVFPVWEKGALVYYQARAMWEPSSDEHFVKALNPPADGGGIASSDVLFNLDVARRYPRVAVTEGPIDAVKTGVDAVCTFGKQIHGPQISKLRSAGVRALDIMWDSDAIREAESAARDLSGAFDVRIVKLPVGDPGDYSRAQIMRFRKNAVPFQPAPKVSYV